jgi:hypothetical protein
VLRALRVAQECSGKTYAESGRDDRSDDNSREIKTIFDDLSLPPGLHSRTVSVLGSRLGLLSGWRRCSLLVTRFPHDPVSGCLSSDLSEQRGRCRPGARLLA